MKSISLTKTFYAKLPNKALPVTTQILCQNCYK
jgi:hypothetical protein